MAVKDLLLLAWPLVLFFAATAWLLALQPQITWQTFASLTLFGAVAVWALLSSYQAAGLRGIESSLQQEALVAADRSQAVMDAAADGVVSADAAKAIISFNPGAERLFGLKAADMLGQPLDRLFAEAWRVPANSFFDTLLRKQTGNARLKIGETLALHKDGHEFPLYVTLSMNQSSGEPVLFLVARDISARKRVEQKLSKSAESQKVLNQLLRLSLEEGRLDQLLMRALDSIFSFPWLSSQTKGGLFLSGAGAEAELHLVAQQGMEPDEIGHFKKHGAAQASHTPDNEEPGGGGTHECAMVDEAYAIKYCSMRPQGYYSLPIVSSGRLLGIAVLYVLEGQQNHEDEITFLEAVSHTLASLIEKTPGRRRPQRERGKPPGQAGAAGRGLAGRG
jgi:PAS domain S-box-containing protein